MITSNINTSIFSDNKISEYDEIIKPKIKYNSQVNEVEFIIMDDIKIDEFKKEDLDSTETIKNKINNNIKTKFDEI